MSADTLYQRLVAAGVPTSNWQSDLYFKAGPAADRVLREARAAGVYTSNPTLFINRVEGGYWYEAPFMFDPYWEKRNAKPDHKPDPQHQQREALGA